MPYNFQEILEQWPPARDPWSMDDHNECEGKTEVVKPKKAET